jgi:hypothetical protein
MLTDEQHRRFGIADGLIVVAGLAAGMGLVRITNPGITPGQVRDVFLTPAGGWSLRHAAELILETGVIFVIPFVAAWTPACLLVQVTGSRSRWRRLRRGPGFVACLIASAVILATFAVAAALLAASVWDVGTSGGDYYLKAQVLGGVLAGSGVLWGWVTMRLCGVYRPALTWTDRLGRLTGAAWVLLGAISACYLALTMS